MSYTCSVGHSLMAIPLSHGEIYAKQTQGMFKMAVFFRPLRYSNPSIRCGNGGRAYLYARGYDVSR